MSQRRIWYQSFVDPVDQANYINQLQITLNEFADKGFEFELRARFDSIRKPSTWQPLARNPPICAILRKCLSREP